MKKIIKFSASWCGPCKQLIPVFEVLKEKYKDEVEFEEIDVKKEPKLAEKYQVRGVPTVVLEIDGEEVHRLVGLKSISEYQEMIESEEI